MSKLRLDCGRWFIGHHQLHCGDQVKISCRSTDGKDFLVWGRFEIAGQNNPVFYTVFGRVVPDLDTTLFVF